MNRPNSVARRSGFTLIEILVVLAIAAIITSITFGAFKSIAEGNRRTTCQSNLSQIYQACRLYSQDFDSKFPYLNGGAETESVATHTNTPKGGLGLWSLYTFPATTGSNCSTSGVNLPVQNDNSLTGYVRSNRVFHCPADDYKRNAQYFDTSCQTQSVDSGVFTFQTGVSPNLITRVNPTYLSYQVDDDFGVTSPATVDTYSSFRKADTPALRVRQIVPFIVNGSTTQIVERPTRDLTVITWCRFHRKLSDTGATQAGRRNYDNVLFSDGSVQNLPAEQNVTDLSNNTATCTGWQRVPRGKADTLVAPASNCIPSP